MRKVYFVLSLVLVLAVFLSACDMEGKGSSDVPDEASSELESVDVQGGEAEKSSQKRVSDAQVDKSETVYVKADADGMVREIDVEAVLKNPVPCSGSVEADDTAGAAQNLIEDYSVLQDIKNTKGDEEFTEQGNGVILWENHGEDIYYKGTSQDALPVSVKVRYFLNGKEMRAEDMVGRSGEVRIRFDYENHTSRNVKIDGKQVPVKVPFAVLSAMVLPSDLFSYIEVSGGKLVTMDEQNVVVGVAYPGLEESLKLADYEPAKAISLPNHVEVTAQVTDFELDFTATVITTGTFSDLDLKDLDDADTLIEDMSKLTDASSELVDGTTELLKGANTFQSYLKEYTEGMDTVNEGAAALTSGLKVLNTEKKNLETGAATLQDGLKELNSALAQFSISSSGYSDSKSSDSENSSQELISDAGTLASQLSALQKSMDQIQDFTSDAAAYTGSVQSTVKIVNDELSSALEELNKIETEANNTAKKQIKEAADNLLADMELSEEEKAAIQKKLENSISLSGITAQAQKHINTAIKHLSELPSLTVPEFSIDYDAIMKTVSHMQTQMNALKNNSNALNGITSQLSSLQNALSTLKNGAGQLQDGSKQLTEGIAAFNQGIEQLYDGSSQLSSGTKKLSENGSALTDGFSTLADGLKELKNGVKTFDEEGIQNLNDLAGDDLENLICRIKALKEADSSYHNFSGIKKGQTGSVRFIIETDEITAK